MRLMIPILVGAAIATTSLVAIGLNLDTAPKKSTAPVEMVVLQPGSFDFRLPGEYLKADWPVDAPKRKVTFNRGFEIMKYQVGIADYDACVKDGACQAPEAANTNADRPVTGINYRDATAYAAWLSEKTGENWRLPTNEEWAFAAAERLQDDALGLPEEATDNPATRWLARYNAETGSEPRDPEPKPRGHFGENSKGIADIAGNVWDWTTSCYLRATVDGNDKITRSIENCGVRVLGGRHRSYMSHFIRDGKSGGCAAGLAPDNLGIRLVREPLTLAGRAARLWSTVIGA
ncbi:SUMF1/EgtB/PvdO family nonheme iron enzyme [Aquamicrobium segne]|uniref:SUMF1/EgtB/PvdO family nonheme iron enzyme n=1 Tax=Aquamicrobium segne TaxID=469547 RepID=A0ABW0GX16_9HYPH